MNYLQSQGLMMLANPMMTVGANAIPEVQFQANRIIGQRDADALIAELNTPIPVRRNEQVVELCRFYPCEKNSHNGQPQRKAGIFTSSPKIVDLPGMLGYWYPDTIALVGGYKVVLYGEPNFQGNIIGVIATDAYRQQDFPGGVGSVIALPNLDFDAKLQRVITALTNLATPAGGCILSAGNFKDHPVYTAALAYIDRVAALVPGTPLETQYAQTKEKLRNEVLTSILQSGDACKNVQAPIAPINPNLPPAVPPGVYPGPGSPTWQNWVRPSCPTGQAWQQTRRWNPQAQVYEGMCVNTIPGAPVPVQIRSYEVPLGQQFGGQQMAPFGQQPYGQMGYGGQQQQQFGYNQFGQPQFGGQQQFGGGQQFVMQPGQFGSPNPQVRGMEVGSPGAEFLGKLQSTLRVY